jgi:AcrR family transcriptional regulator
VRLLYMKYGIKSVTMDDVARELGISKKTLYQYVIDKNDLVGKFIDLEIDIRTKEIYDCIKTGFNAIEELFELTTFMIRITREHNPATEYDLKKYYPVHYQKIIETRRTGIFNFILQNLKKGQNEGLYRDDLNEEIIAKLYLARSESIHLNDLYSIEEFTSSEIQTELLRYHIRGIASEKGIIALENKIKDLEKEKQQK